jgi:DNA primase
MAGRYVSPDKMPKLEAPALPNGYMERYEDLPIEALDYLRGEERGLEDYTIDFWGLKFDRREQRIMIPIFDLKGRLIATSGRAIHDYTKPKYRHMSGFKRRYQLFGEDPKVREPSTSSKLRGIVVEGQFDVIHLWQLGYRTAVAMYGSSMTPQQIERFKSMFSSAIFLTDGDEPGEIAGEKLKLQFNAADIPIELAATPDGLDAGHPKFTLAHAKSILGEPEVDNDW